MFLSAGVGFQSTHMIDEVVRLRGHDLDGEHVRDPTGAGTA